MPKRRRGAPLLRQIFLPPAQYAPGSSDSPPPSRQSRDQALQFVGHPAMIGHYGPIERDKCRAISGRRCIVSTLVGGNPSVVLKKAANSATSGSVPSGKGDTKAITPLRISIQVATLDERNERSKPQGSSEFRLPWKPTQSKAAAAWRRRHPLSGLHLSRLCSNIFGAKGCRRTTPYSKLRRESSSRRRQSDDVH